MWHQVTFTFIFALWHPSGATYATWHAVDDQVVICPNMTVPNTLTPGTISGGWPVESGYSIKVPFKTDSGMNLSTPHAVIFSRQGKKRKVSITYRVTDATEQVVLPSTTIELQATGIEAGGQGAAQLPRRRAHDGAAEEDGEATTRQLGLMPNYLKGLTNLKENTHEDADPSFGHSHKKALTPAALAHLIVHFDTNHDGVVNLRDAEGSQDESSGDGRSNKVTMESHKEKQCNGTAYTNVKHGKKTGCNGWFGITAKHCMENCATNARAPFCPKKECAAAVFFPAPTKHNKHGGWCHLYAADQCKDIKENWGHPITFKKSTVRRLGEGGATESTVHEVQIKEGAHFPNSDDAPDARQLQGISASSLARVISHFDTNGDGKIDLQDAEKDGSEDWKEFAGKFGGHTASPSFETIKEKVCKGKAYTNVKHGKKNGCNGFVNIDARACLQKCATNARAPFCPRKHCTASVYFPTGKDKGWCHLYTGKECEQTIEDWGHPITFKKSHTRRLEANSARGKQTVEGEEGDAVFETDGTVRDDTMGIRFIPRSYASPITIKIEAIKGEDFSQEDICPKDKADVSNTIKSASGRQHGLFVTLKEIREFAAPPPADSELRQHFHCAFIPKHAFDDAVDGVKKAQAADGPGGRTTPLLPSTGALAIFALAPMCAEVHFYGFTTPRPPYHEAGAHDMASEHSSFRMAFPNAKWH